MGRCLTPTGWSPRVERREATFLATTPEAERDELFERIAVWEAWVFELGGVPFVEPARRGRRRTFTYVLVVGGQPEKAAMKTDDRALALRMLHEMRSRSSGVRVEVIARSRVTERLQELRAVREQLFETARQACIAARAAVERTRVNRARGEAIRASLR